VGDLVPDDSANALSDLVVAAAQPLDRPSVDEYAIRQRQVISRPPCVGNADVATRSVAPAGTCADCSSSGLGQSLTSTSTLVSLSRNG